jgi:hypothetical protein
LLNEDSVRKRSLANVIRQIRGCRQFIETIEKRGRPLSQRTLGSSQSGWESARSGQNCSLTGKQVSLGSQLVSRLTQRSNIGLYGNREYE